MFSEASVLVQSMGWTLLHSLWQGAVIAAGLWLVLKMIPNARSNVKYHLSLASLALLTVWVAGTWMQQWQLLQAVQVHVTESAANAAPARTYIIATLPQASGSWSWLQPLWPALERAFPWLVGGYLTGLLLMSLRLAAGFTHLYRIRRTGLGRPAQQWLQLLDLLKERLEIDGRVQLFFSSRVQLPMVMGILKPVILLPAASLAQLSPQQLEAILLHELAHIRRNDYLINLVQTVVETILFFNPFVWQLSAIIRREREHCCDDLVLDNAQERLPYATALASLEMARAATPVGALAASGQPRHLLNRIQRIMEMKNNPSNYSRMIAAVLVVTLIACSVVWLTPSFGQSKSKQKEETSSHKEQPATNHPSTSPDDNVTPRTPNAASAGTGRVMHHTDSALRIADAALNSIDMEQIGKTVDEAMKHVDWNEISRAQEKAMKEAGKAMKQAEKAMKSEDWKKLSPAEQREVQAALEEAGRALKELDMDDIRNEVATAMKDVDWTKIQAEVQQSLEEVQRELNDPERRKQIRKEVEKARADVAEAAREARAAALDEAAARREEAREAARAHREEALAERDEVQEHRAEARAHRESVVAVSGSGRVSDYRQMLDQMEADGLIDRDRAFAIAYSNNKLTINGKEQPQAVREKYRSFLDGKHIAIAGSKNNLAIQAD